MSNERGQGPHDRFMRHLMGDGPREKWSSLSDPTRECWAAADGAPNQLTSVELGKLVEVAARWCPSDLANRVREAWLAHVRWEADHG